MKLTLIISYYKAPYNLKLILGALNEQSCMDFSVIISEDDANTETINFIKDHRHLYNFSIAHLYQKEDDGFRKNMMLNRSVKSSPTDKIVFIDGDCIPHKHFVKEYIMHLKPGFIFFGRRVFLGKELTKKIKQHNKLVKINFIHLLFSDSRKIKESLYNPWFSMTDPNRNKGLVGCNWGIMKQELIAVNGFDEDYILPGTGEDTDIEWRLRANGLKMKSMKNKAILYHLHHETTRSEEINRVNHQMLAEKKKAHKVFCINGLEKG